MRAYNVLIEPAKTMKHPINQLFFLILLSIVLFPTTSASGATKSDLDKERRWEAQIVPELMVGDAIKLKANDLEFLGLYTPSSTEKSHGGVLLIHGIGLHPAWPDIIEPLRSHLPEHGWHTLSIQMPILRNEAEPKDYVPLMDEAPARIQAGVDFLKKQGLRNIVIIAHSLGTAMAGYYLTNKPDPSVRAYVGISMGYFPFDKRFDTTLALEKLRMPVLDIYGGQDLDDILRNAGRRKQAALKAKNKAYEQIKIEGASHFFTNMDDTLVKRIRGWLLKNAPGTEIQTQIKTK